jgi:phenylacetate-coenzyme A ligase PaaK-like adenylate-forming protein
LKIDPIRKRLESIVTLDGGDTIYPSLFDDALYEIPGVLDYQVVCMQQEKRERLEFNVEVMSPDARTAIHRKLLSIPVIMHRIATGRMIEPAVLPVPIGSLQSASRSKKLIVVNGV